MACSSGGEEDAHPRNVALDLDASLQSVQPIATGSSCADTKTSPSEEEPSSADAPLQEGQAEPPPPPASVSQPSAGTGLTRRARSAETRKTLEFVLAGQFGEVRRKHSLGSFSTLSGDDDDTDTEVSEGDLHGGELGQLNNESRLKATCISLVENRVWISFFMILTFYALFVPDLDLALGTKTSKYVFSIITTAVFAVFLVELLCHSYAKRGYFLRAFFWLDVVALISLLPDTWLVQLVLNNNAFVAGRSSRLSRLIRLAARSSKAMRLNRLTRMVRVAALMPRIAAAFGRQDQQEAERLLDKKLHRIFAFLDDDMDGSITQERLDYCLSKLIDSSKIVHNRSGLSRGSGSSLVSRSSGRFEEPDSPRSPRTPASPTTPGTSQRHPSRRGTRRPSFGTPTSVRFQDAEPPKIPRPVSQAGSRAASTGRKPTWHKDMTFATEAQDTGMIDFIEFKHQILEDPVVKNRLLRSCREQLRRSNNMQNIASRHTEDIGVKVAMGILALLLVVYLVEPGGSDSSAALGLQLMDAQVRLQLGNFSNSTNSTIPLPVQEQVVTWRENVASGDALDVVYLDLGRRVYCNELVSSGQRCDVPVGTQMAWPDRGSLEDVDSDQLASSFRGNDLVVLRVPDIDDSQLSNAELDKIITSVALINDRSRIQAEARVSMLTTGVVIVIILAGIVVLTKDLTFLSRSLLRPLRTLTEEMQSIEQLQLAGMSGETASSWEKGTAEVRLLQRMFENTKKAIRSWGKYVPWPVVKLLLSAGVDAKPGVTEKEVTLFFSDIASFTTIVESIPPESSLLLLSRYFNDMSKVIDEHGGIVIEFIGDAILSVFGAPLRNPDHPTATVRATLRMLGALAKINQWSQTKGLPEVSIRCGIHTGPVLVGNMGFHSRMKYGVVGENANIPARLEELNKTYGTNMLISEATHRLLDAEAFITRPIDYVYVRQGPDAVGEPVFQVLGRAGSNSRLLELLQPVAELHTAAMSYYRNRDFQEAAQRFEEVTQQMKEITGAEDQPAEMLLKRCKVYMQRPPPEDWDGVWDQASEP